MKTTDKNKNKIIYIFILCEIFFVFLFCAITNNRAFYSDSNAYWQLGASFWEGPEFSFFHYPLDIRGYVYPLICGVCGKLGGVLNNEMVFYWLYISTICVVGNVIIIPSIFDIKINTKHCMYGGALSIALFAFFWKDLLIYPLTDYSAFFFYVLSIYLMKITNEEKRWKYKCLYSFLIGISLYFCYNIRTVYLIPICILLLLFAVYIKLGNGGIKSFICIFLLLFLGTLISSIPQIIINWNNIQMITPAVKTNSLALLQLKWGIYVPRYETLAIQEPPVGDSVCFYDSIGLSICNECEINSIGDYLLCFIKHPIEMMGFYAEHFLSGITLLRNELYWKELKFEKIIWFSNFCCWLLGFWKGMFVIYNKQYKKKVREIIALIMICFPAILATPGAIETRFWIACYVLLYIFITMTNNSKDFIDYMKKDWGIKLAATLGLFLICCLYVVNIISKVQVFSIVF